MLHRMCAAAPCGKAAGLAAADAIIGTQDAEKFVDTGQQLSEIFDLAMAAMGPWEPAPHLTVAVSGGPDSLALCLLAHAWAESRGGIVDAVTVDHGLRSASEVEAAQVGGWLSGQGIRHHILVWHGPKPQGGIQEAARNARYGLLEAHCRESGSLHLLLGHQFEDQLETVRMRAARQASGPGLAGMSVVTERPHCRILRPLLGVEKASLKDYLRALAQPWIDDPTNVEPAYERTRLRADPLPLADQQTLAQQTNVAGNERQSSEKRLAGAMARNCRAHPAGFVLIDPIVLDGNMADAASLLSAAISMVGGPDYAPGRSTLDALVQRFQDNPDDHTATTLGGCWIGPFRREGLRWLAICREAGRTAEPTPLNAERFNWDGRIAVHTGSSDILSDQYTVGALGEGGWAQVSAEIDAPVAKKMPPAARHALPGLFQGSEVLCVPNLRFAKPLAAQWPVSLAFCPKRPLAGAGFRGPAALAAVAGSIV